MIKLGEYNRLRVVKRVDFGIFLDGGEYWGEILLPRESMPEKIEVGDELEVFIYFDSEDRIIATTTKPKAVVGEFALMKVVGTNSVGAFLDWGLRKDLLVPFREQQEKMIREHEYLVYLYVDKTTDRIVASSKWRKFLNRKPATYREGDEVQLIIARQTDLGFSVIVDNQYEAVIYKNEIFQPLSIGQHVVGYIKTMREDGKIDCILQKNDGYHQIDQLSQHIMDQLKNNGGELNISDKSDPEEIYRILGCSKKNYKKAIGGLFKKRLINIEDNKISLINI